MKKQKQKNVLVALGWYDHRLLQGIATYAHSVLACLLVLVSFTAFAGADKPPLPRNADRIVVAADGSGDFTAVQAAVDFAEAHRQKPVVIFISAASKARTSLRIRATSASIM